jgi:rod shape-determining protein MreD
MSIDLITRIAVFFVISLSQALVLNRIQLFGWAMPLLYVYFVVMFPRSYPRWAMLLWAFVMGFVGDMFANTPGVTSASLTLVALVQPYLLELFVPHDAEENMPAAAFTMGWGRFLTFTVILTFLFCLLFFTLEAFTFFHWLRWLLSILGSTLLTVALIMTLETLRQK